MSKLDVATPAPARRWSARVSAMTAAAAVLLAIAPIAMPGAARAGDFPFSDLFSDPNRDWVELTPTFPAPPKDDRLVEFYVSPIADFRFSVDRDSISIGSDGVVRYTLVAISRDNVRSVRYEGLRCVTHESKIYAIGSPDGKWSEARDPVWKRIDESPGNRPEAALAKDAVCKNGLLRSPAEMVSELSASPRNRLPQ